MIHKSEYHGHHQEWLEAEPVLISEALEGLSRAQNYRDFVVSAAARVVHALADRSLRCETIVGHNHMPTRGDYSCKMCAEPMAFYQIHNRAKAKVIGFVLAAPYQIDDLHKKDMRGTLPPCFACRMLIRELVGQGVLHAHTAITSLRVALHPIHKLNTCVCIELIARYTVGDLLQEFADDLKYSHAS